MPYVIKDCIKLNDGSAICYDCLLKEFIHFPKPEVIEKDQLPVEYIQKYAEMIAGGGEIMGKDTTIQTTTKDAVFIYDYTTGKCYKQQEIQIGELPDIAKTAIGNMQRAMKRMS